MKFSTAAALSIAIATMPATAALADAHMEAKAEAPAAALTINTPIETLMSNDASKAVLVKHLGEMDQHPAYGQFKTMSLVELKPWSQGAITDEIIEKVKADLAAL